MTSARQIVTALIAHEQEPARQNVAAIAPRAGKSRVKPRQLSPLLKRSIVEQFLVRQSTEDVAEELRLPVRCVSDVIQLAALKGDFRRAA